MTQPPPKPRTLRPGQAALLAMALASPALLAGLVTDDLFLIRKIEETAVRPQAP